MPYCPVCSCDFDDTVAACPYCGSDLVDDMSRVDEAGDSTGIDGDEGNSDQIGEMDLQDAVLLYRSHSRVNTDFLVETLRSARIPYYCRIIGGHYGRGIPGSVGFFGSESVDAEIYVPSEFEDDAAEIRRQTVGD
jgi:hypothetical protein